MWRRRRSWDGTSPVSYASPRGLHETNQGRHESTPEDLIKELARDLRSVHALGTTDVVLRQERDNAWFTARASEILVTWGLIEPTGDDDSDG